MIRELVVEGQSRITCQTVNEVDRSTSRAKHNAACPEERIQLWKQHFENLPGKPPKVNHEPITNIINNQQDIRLGQFTQEELDSVQRQIKNRKAAGLNKILPEV